MDKGLPSEDLIDIARTLEGDLAAFTAIVDRYKYMVYTLAMRMLRNHEEAEEAAQDSFVKAYNALSNFNGTSKFSTWLYKIAYNQCLDCLRRWQRQPGFTTEWPMEKLDSKHPEILHKLENEDLRNSLQKAINRLDRDDSLVITFFYLEEMNLDEISSVMGISANTAKVRLHRARKKLGEILMDHKEYYKAKTYGHK